MKRALTPGTFDPITSGHLDVIARADVYKRQSPASVPRSR